jgi:lipopolysaccharide export system ATP-binding protein
MPILEVRGLIKAYWGRKVVDGVDFEVDAGEIVGLLGPNGAGKTTSFRMITGQVKPNEGQVLFNGRDIAHLPMFRRARLGLGYLAQEYSVFRKLTVEQNILAVLEVLPVYRSLGRKLTRAERYQKTDEVLTKFGLTHLRKNSAARLSGGERRRLEIARCLVCDPLLILMDEPFAAIDPQTVDDIQKIIRGLREEGIGILVTDHNAREILKVTSRVYLITKGKVRAHGTPHQIVNDPIAIEEYLGESFAADGINLGGGLGIIPAAALPPPAPAPSEGIHAIVEQEKIHRLIDRLKTADQPAAAAELLQRGSSVIPALLEALERKDVEMRRQAFAVLQRLLEGADFDPFAPEMQRRRQLAVLREALSRKAG